jgi:hypothetical protein
MADNPYKPGTVQWFNYHVRKTTHEDAVKYGKLRNALVELIAMAERQKRDVKTSELRKLIGE